MNNMYDYYNYMNNLNNYNNGFEMQNPNNNDLYNMIGLNNNQIIKDNNILDPYTGFIRGNLFGNLYSQYKNYKPDKVKGKNLREEQLMQIMELEFTLNDLGLYLDIYKNDMNALNLFKNYSIKKEELCKNYENKYGPLERNFYNINTWKWDNSPWPWESE